MGTRSQIRNRFRTKPINKIGSSVGFWYSATSLNGPWSIVNSTPFKPLPDAPYLEAQRTLDQLNPGPPYETGGAFNTARVFREDGETPVKGSGTYTSASTYLGRYYRYVGGFYNPIFYGDEISSYTDYVHLFSEPSLYANVAPYRPTVFSKLRPKIEVADLGQSVAELSDLPRMLKTTAKLFSQEHVKLFKSLGGFATHKANNSLQMPKHVADQFLNYQFGWRPFLKDLSDLFDLVDHSRVYMDQVNRSNNTWQRRARTLGKSETPYTWTDGGYGTACSYRADSAPLAVLCPPATGNQYAWWWSYRSELITEWATGWFKFYRPDFDKSLANYDSYYNRISRTIKLAGLTVNPTLIYKITPWSWLIDWFTNVGDTISAIDAAASDGVVSKNLYLMGSRQKQLILKQFINFSSGSTEFEWKRVISSKTRERAENPFGFGLSPESLSGKQWAILGSLGLSRWKP